jgi:bacteriorhodopsin
MKVDPTLYAAIAIVAALVLIAVRSNRKDKHPAISAFAWICAITVFVWTAMVWLATK